MLREGTSMMGLMLPGNRCGSTFSVPIQLFPCLGTPSGMSRLGLSIQDGQMHLVDGEV